MNVVGSLAFGAMAVVNLTVLAIVVVGLFRRTRAHHGARAGPCGTASSTSAGGPADAARQRRWRRPLSSVTSNREVVSETSLAIAT